MRNVEAHLLVDKMDEAVTHYINSHQSNEGVHIDTNGIPMTVQDDGGGRVTVMHQQTYTTQMCRQVSVTEQVGEGPWGEELLEGPIAAIVAHLQNTRHHPAPQHKVAQMRNDVDNSVILDGTMRFNGTVLSQGEAPLPALPALPPLRDMKRGADTHWFTDKNKKAEAGPAPGAGELALAAGTSPAPHRQHSRKSLPHKKRISKKLKRTNGPATPQQELVVINCSEAAPEQEQILPDNFVAAHHMTHEVRAVFICQVCGEYYGDEQLKFYHHLRQHYEPHDTIIIENPVGDLAIDKLTNNCMVDTVAALPDSIVELTLESAAPRHMYQQIPLDKHGLYADVDKPAYATNKLQYSMAMDKEPGPTPEAVKADLYESLDKLELYNCGKCNKTFRKQKQYEAHVREGHSANTKLEDMSEFSEPEDLMAGIQVCVEEPYEQTLLPHLTVENGTVHQDHTRHWYGRGACGCGGCGGCSRDPDQPLKVLKEEVLQRIFDGEVPDNPNFGDNMMPDHDVGQDQDHDPDHDHEQAHVHSNEHGHSHEHGHIQDHEHSHEHEQTHRHHGHEHVELGHDHSEHIHGHNDHTHTDQEFNCHGHNEHGYSHSEHGHDHGHNEHVHDPSENGHVHSEHGHDHTEHGHDHSEHGHSHSELSQEHSDNEQNDDSDLHPHEVPLKQELLQKDEIEPGDKGKHYECTECGRVFTHRNSLLYHVLSHGSKRHACRDCDKMFYTLGALKIHKRVHNGDRPYKCEECGREFRQWSDLRYHKISLHSDKKHFKCEYCGKEFARKYSLNIHVRIHTGEKNYKCDYCPKSFRASSYRLSHMRTHTGVRPYKCELCEKSFRSAFDLRRHTLVHDKGRAHKLADKLADDEHKRTDTDTGEDQPPANKRIKQVALASTARPAGPKKVSKPRQKGPKRGAPNVTVQSHGQFGADRSEVGDEREYAKFKNVYESEQDERANLTSDDGKWRENTDGKLHVFTHVDKERTPRRPTNDFEPGFVERLTAIYKI